MANLLFSSTTDIATVNGYQTILHKNNLKSFSLTVNKKDNNNADLMGASFSLSGPDGYFVALDGTDRSKFDFEGLSPGTYILTETETPHTHIGLEASLTIVIDAEGNVTLDDDSIAKWVTLKAGTDSNTIEFDVTNVAKNPLPATGGMGAAIFYLVGAIVIAGVLVNVYLKKRKGAA